MANIFAILTALVLALAAFVAFKNQGKTEEPGAGYKGWIAKREDMVSARKRAQKRLKEVEDELAETEKTLAGVEADNEKKTAENAAQKTKNEELEAEVAAL